MKYWVTKKTLKDGKSHRLEFQSWKSHGFKYLWWIKSIKVEDNETVIINFKHGLKVTYIMIKDDLENLLRDCGLKYQETF